MQVFSYASAGAENFIISVDKSVLAPHFACDLYWIAYVNLQRMHQLECWIDDKFDGLLLKLLSHFRGKFFLDFFTA